MLYSLGNMCRPSSVHPGPLVTVRPDPEHVEGSKGEQCSGQVAEELGSGDRNQLKL